MNCIFILLLLSSCSRGCGCQNQDNGSDREGSRGRCQRRCERNCERVLENVCEDVCEDICDRGGSVRQERAERLRPDFQSFDSFDNNANFERRRREERREERREDRREERREERREGRGTCGCEA